MRIVRRLIPAICACLLPATAGAAADEIDYLRDVKPLLAQKCGACHGAVRQKAGLRLDGGVHVHRGGESGPAIVSGKSDESLLVRKLTAADGETLMPPEGEGTPLTAAEIERVRRWIDAGAKYPADEAIAADPRDHWSFKPPKKPPVPAVKHRAWVRNEIDALVVARLEASGLTPNDEADRATLLRRVYLDLIGLPPTRAELHAFLDDRSADAYEKVVDRLLARTEYGERWGRHWMDVWRYSDWHGSGNEIRYGRRHLWRWRDWIVKSLNADKGYDRMIVEMLAGDEAAPNDPEVVAATGFICRNWYKFDRNVWMNELVEHTAVGFLGMTLKCARCHDHKFDPISQEEYYRFRAFFEPHQVRTDLVSAVPEMESFSDGGKPVPKDGLSRAYDQVLDAPTYLFERGDDRRPVKDRPLEPGVPQALGGRKIEIRPVSLPAASYAPMLRREMADEMRRAADKEVATAEEAHRSAPCDASKLRLRRAWADRESLRARIAADAAKHVTRADPKRIEESAVEAARREREAAAIRAELAVLEAEQAVAEAKKPRAVRPGSDAERSTGGKPPADDDAEKALAAAEKKRTEARKALDAALGDLKKTDARYTPLGEVYPATSTGRRRALAEWIADGTNPRTARVAVNQIWMRHFGEPLAATVADFGLRAKPLTHPELSDWLAVEFVEHGWSMKHLHRLIVTSATYRQSSAARSGAGDSPAEASGAGKSLALIPSRRLEAEAIRDSVLAIAGMLDATVGGKEIPYSQDQTVPRRSLYFQTAPNRQSMMLAVFDFAGTEECYDRKPSVTPQQSLALLNSPLAVNASRKVAERHAESIDEEFVTAVFEEVLSRPPTPAEAARCRAYLETESRRLAATKTGPTLPPSAGPIAVASPASRARENLVLVLFNHNDFVTVR